MLIVARIFQCNFFQMIMLECFLVLLTCTLPAQEPRRVSIIQWTDLAFSRRSRELFEAEMRQRSDELHQPVEITHFNAHGNREELENQIANFSGTDLFVTINNDATQELSRIGPAIPVLALNVYYPEEMGSNPEFNKRIIGGSCMDINYDYCIRIILEHWTDTKRVCVVRTEGQRIPELQSQRLRAGVELQGVKFSETLLAPGFCRNEADISEAVARLTTGESGSVIWLLEDGNTHRFLRHLLEMSQRSGFRVVGTTGAFRQGADACIETNVTSLTIKTAQNAVSYILDGIEPGFKKDNTPSIRFRNP